MIMENTDPYRPCPCGSGKKFKFCCRDKQRAHDAQQQKPLLQVLNGLDDNSPDELDVLMPEGDEIVFDGDMEEGRRLCEKGLKLMGRGKFSEAIPWFKKSHVACPVVYTPANNAALCMYVEGRLDDSIRFLQESLEESPLPNPFGLACMASFFLVKGDEKEAERYLNEALEEEMPSEDACIKVCETLARFKRHKDILELADSSGYADHPGVCFFTGIAAANLGKRKRAETDLRRVSLGHPKVDMAQRYLRFLREKSSPYTVLGDWPYLQSHEVCPFAVIKSESLQNLDNWNTRRIAVSSCEVLLNDSGDDPSGSVIQILERIKHPDAHDLLWAIVKGSFGPDALRMAALSALQKRGDVKQNQKVDMLVDGKRTAIAAMGTQLNPDFRFGKELPPDLDKRYIKAIKAGRARRPNWEKIAETYLLIMKEEPEFYPARYNYAVSLLHRRRSDEAEPILKEIFDAHPDYLFAPATLLQIYTTQDRDREADQVIRAVTLPEETHPAAMITWLIAQMLHYERQELYDTAKRCITMAHQIEPDHPTVKAFWKDYQ